MKSQASDEFSPRFIEVPAPGAKAGAAATAVAPEAAARPDTAGDSRGPIVVPLPRPLGRATLVGVLGVLLLANLGVTLFVSAERTIYYWDYSNYWRLSKYWVALAHGPLKEAGRVLRQSVATEDYNHLPAVPLGLWMALVGDSRVAYCLGIVNLYVLGVLLMLPVCCRQFWGPAEARRGDWIMIVPSLVVLLTPPFWEPVLRGYVDVAGVAIALTILWLYFRSTDRPALHPGYAAIGLLLAGLFLYRRWYLFWVVSFVLLVGLDRLSLLVRDGWRRQLGLRRAVRLLVPIALVVGVTAVTALIVAGPMIHRVMGTDYADIYSAYRNGGAFQQLATMVDRFGWLTLGYGLVAAVGLMRWPQTRRLSLLVSGQAVLMFLQFTSVQSFGAHHLYLFLPGYLLLVGVFTVKVACLPTRTWPRVAWLAGLVGLGMAASAAGFVPRAHASLLPSTRLLPRHVCYSMVRHDLPELIRMLGVVDGYMDRTEGGLYVLASSEVFSPDTLINAPESLPVPFRAVERITPCAYIDKRDGFPVQLVRARFVLVAIPAQYHLHAKDQRVVGYPVDNFVHGTGLAMAFERLPETFRLDGGVRVVLYRRTREVEPAEIAELSAQLRAAYPDRPFVYTYSP